MNYGKDVFLVPLTDAAGKTKLFKKGSHLGLDVGWYKNQYCPVLARQDGTVVDFGYSSEVGHFFVLEHKYTATKRWTGYIHLKGSPEVYKGQKFELGQRVGKATRGNTGKSNGTHLHIYLTQEVPITTTYTWNTMLSNATDPEPFLCVDAKFNTDYMAPSWVRKLAPLKYPEPVERDELREQIEIKSKTRNLRKGPGLKFETYPNYCSPGVYNVDGWTASDGYDWTKLGEIDGNVFYVAVMNGEELPIADYKKLYGERLEANAILVDQLAKATGTLARIKKEVEDY